MSTRRNGEKGQGLIEYALILILVALIVVVCLALPAILAIGWVVSNWSAIVVWGSGWQPGGYLYRHRRCHRRSLAHFWPPKIGSRFRFNSVSQDAEFFYQI